MDRQGKYALVRLGPNARRTLLPFQQDVFLVFLSAAVGSFVTLLLLNCAYFPVPSISVSLVSVILPNSSPSTQK